MTRFRPLALCSTLLLGAAPATAAPQSPIQLRARAFQPGEVVVLTVTPPRRTTTVRIAAFGHDVPAFEEAGKWKALIGIDLDQRPGAYAVKVEALAGADVLKTLERGCVVKPKRFRTRRLTVNPSFVNPPPEVLEQIEHDSVLLKGVYARSAQEKLWQTFVRPVPGEANSAFGTRSVFNGEARNPHSGADFMSGAGTPIKAPASGRIVVARDLYFTGNTVIIDHGLDVFSMLAHLSRIDVKEGGAIAAGDIVGLVGATGRVTGPHLHWSLRIGSARVDPLSALAVLGQ